MQRYLFIALLVVAATALSMDPRTLAEPVTSGCHSDVPRYDVAVPGHPFGVAQSADGASAFVAINSSDPLSPTGIGVLQCAGGRYHFSHIISLESGPTGIALTHDGRLLIVADDGFVVFLDPVAAIAGKQAVIGYLQDSPGDVEDNSAGSIHVTVSPDDRFAFISDEANLSITVIDLARARRNGFTRDAIVGAIPVANAPIAAVFSRDGRHLFTTSEIGRRSYGWPVVCKPEGDPSAAPANLAGAIITVDVATAETNAAKAVINKTPSDCATVRLALSPDGSTAWATNRGSNTVTAFSTEKLIAGDAEARVLTIAVGSNPVGIAVTADGRYVLAANSNRFGPGGPKAGTLSVIDSARKAVIGTIPVGVFPREFSPGSGATLFLANNRSNTITVFDTARLNELMSKRADISS